jgi:hypothetical protein
MLQVVRTLADRNSIHSTVNNSHGEPAGVVRWRERGEEREIERGDLNMKREI